MLIRAKNNIMTSLRPLRLCESLFVSVTQAGESAFVIGPALANFHPQLQVYLAFEHFFYIDTRLAADAFQPCPLASYDNGLLTLGFDIDGGEYSADGFSFFKAFDFYSPVVV
jgi:hypothetical protein